LGRKGLDKIFQLSIVVTSLPNSVIIVRVSRICAVILKDDKLIVADLSHGVVDKPVRKNGEVGVSIENGNILSFVFT
jgi:hypothetical protein